MLKSSKEHFFLFLFIFFFVLFRFFPFVLTLLETKYMN